MSNLFYVNNYPVFNSNPPPPPTLTPRGLHMHQFSIDSPEIFFFSTSIVYLSNPYNKQAPRPLEGIYSTNFPCIYPLYRFWAGDARWVPRKGENPIWKVVILIW